jgi:hypothetical protein
VYLPGLVTAIGIHGVDFKSCRAIAHEDDPGASGDHLGWSSYRTGSQSHLVIAILVHHKDVMIATVPDAAKDNLRPRTLRP